MNSNGLHLSFLYAFHLCLDLGGKASGSNAACTAWVMVSVVATEERRTDQSHIYTIGEW